MLLFILLSRLYIERVLYIYIYDYLVFQHAIIAAYSPSPIRVLAAKSESDARHVIDICRITVSRTRMGAVSARHVPIGVNVHTPPWMVSLQQSRYRLICRTTTRSNLCSAPTVTSLRPKLSYISTNTGTYRHSINYDRSCTLYLNNSDKNSWHLRTNSFLWCKVTPTINRSSETRMLLF